jgi:FSR family fosmidomycin resistance protein-like MFS transporter
MSKNDKLAQQPPQRKIMGLIGSGHFLSHFYGLTLPPMFPLFKAEFGVGYAALGLVMACYSLIGGFLQAPVGYLVDRIGPRRVLTAGMGLMAIAIGAIGFVDSYMGLLALAILAGIGNSVFHPADYAILARAIDPRALGRAYSVHTFAGFFGGSVAPITILLLATLTLWEWRAAFVAVGAVGLLVTLAMIIKGSLLDAKFADTGAVDTAKRAAVPQSGSRSALLNPSVLFFFVFFAAYGMATGGLFSFTVTVLTQLHGTSLAMANTAFTGFLLTMAFGVLLGGYAVDRYGRYGLVTAVSLCAGGGVLFVVALVSMPELLLVVAMGFVGLTLGVVLPARDMLLRNMTPPEQTGKVVGFVFVGLSLGSGVSPYLFGWLLDQGGNSVVFILSGVFMISAMAASSTAQILATEKPAVA